MSKTIVSEDQKNELGKQMVKDLMAIVALEQRPIKYFKANKNGVFREVQLDYSDHKHSKK
ncbi:hypothetical protein [Acinetobacter johnsonii]|uniref:hypothetical protein n=1 Tax=Acinetobacter johnsonii TaxID=40214 RepID=UPI002446C0A7|nr:hypothetical protein [Acinetobacter johnsonii]MDH1704555.1 hypothetical protein [Acinetobacter johnsonii]